MEKVEIVKTMQSNEVFMGSMSTRFGLLQTVESFAQAAVRTPEPVKAKLCADLGDIICLMQWMIMLYGNGNVSLTIPANIGYLLHKYCVTPKLYLQHGLTLTELSERIGTNRTYLSSYLAQQGVSYNSYINRLRIDYFEHVFLKALATDRPFTAKQLAYRCGFSSYSTFATAFKQFKGQSVTTWIKEHTPPVEEVKLF